MSFPFPNRKQCNQPKIFLYARSQTMFLWQFLSFYLVQTAVLLVLKVKAWTHLEPRRRWRWTVASIPIVAESWLLSPACGREYIYFARPASQTFQEKHLDLTVCAGHAICHQNSSALLCVVVTFWSLLNSLESLYHCKTVVLSSVVFSCFSALLQLL